MLLYEHKLGDVAVHFLAVHVETSGNVEFSVRLHFIVVENGDGIGSSVSPADYQVRVIQVFRPVEFSEHQFIVTARILLQDQTSKAWHIVFGLKFYAIDFTFVCSCNFLCIQRSFQAIEKISAVSIIDINMQDNRGYIVNYVRTGFRAQVRTGN